MGWLGLLGALWAPAVLGWGDGTEHVYLVIAYAAAIAVLVWRRWTLLAGFAFASATLEWAGFVGNGSELLALVLYGLLAAALAFGFEANRRGVAPVEIGPEARTRPSWFAASVLAIAAALLALAGWFALDGEQWLTALALAHIAAGLVAIRVPRISRELALITLAIGLVLANIAFASVASGLPLVIGWGLSALPFAALLGARRPGHDSQLADLVLGRPHAADRILAVAGLRASSRSPSSRVCCSTPARPSSPARWPPTARWPPPAPWPWSPGPAAAWSARAGARCSTSSRSPRSRTSPASRSKASP